MAVAVAMAVAVTLPVLPIGPSITPSFLRDEFDQFERLSRPGSVMAAGDENAPAPASPRTVPIPANIRPSGTPPRVVPSATPPRPGFRLAANEAKTVSTA